MAVSGLIRAGDVYLIVSGNNIIGRMYIPQECFSNCNAVGCDCGKVEFVNSMSIRGKVVDLTSCRGSIIECVRRLNV